MPEDINREFDRLVKSLMDNAREEVPSHVWSAVESRIPSGKAVPLWMKWGVISAVAAGCLAMGLILSGRQEASTPVTDPLPVIIADSFVPAASETHSGISISSQVPSASATYPIAPVSHIAQVPHTTSTVPDNSEIFSEGTSDPVSESTAEVPDNEPAAEYNPTDMDAFRKMEYEDFLSAKKKARGITASLGGVLSSNDKVRGMGFTNVRMSVADILKTGITKTGVTEAGESSFGIPISAGLGVKFHIGGRFALGTGINYSLLSRKFEGIYTDAASSTVVHGDVTNTVHYIGIPVLAYYDVIKADKLNAYVYGGGNFEKGLTNNFKIHPESGSDVSYKEGISGIQTSVSLGFGLQFFLTDNLGLYLDPGIHYYFDCNQPKSIRTQSPLMFDFQLGARFNLR